MLDTLLKVDQCPSCKRMLDAVTSAFDNSVPKPFDITVCLYCHTVLQLGIDMKLRELSRNEMNRLPDEVLHEIVLLQYTMCKLKEGNRKH